MEKKVLLAEPCELLRIGLRTTLLDDARVAHIYEASTPGNFKTQLRSCPVDLVIVNQMLITDISQLPKGKFVILTAEPDISVLKAAYKYGARGYLSENVSAELLKILLGSSEETFLLEPALTPLVMNSLCGGSFSSIKDELLTPREKEIIQLLREGIDRQTIAKQLCIAEATLKTHIKNIRKREAEQYSEAAL